MFKEYLICVTEFGPGELLIIGIASFSGFFLGSLMYGISRDIVINLYERWLYGRQIS